MFKATVPARFLWVFFRTFYIFYFFYCQVYIKFILIVSSSGSCYNTGEYKNQNSFNFGNPLRSGVKNPYTKLLYRTWPVSSVESTYHINPNKCRGWSGGAMVLGKLPVPGRPTIWIQ